jgi:hypothetical protein
MALRDGRHGLPGGSTLARLLLEHRGRKPRRRGGPLTEERILQWADAHRARTGCWPSAGSGEIVEAPTDTWRRVDFSLRFGHRGLPGGDSLAQLLRRERGDSAMHPWTEAEDELARTLPPAEVAQRMWRAVRAVYTRRRDLGVQRGKAGRDREIAARRDPGETLEAIGERFGLSRQRVAQIVAGQREGKGERAPSRLA